jgi:phosphoserine phosphatase
MGEPVDAPLAVPPPASPIRLAFFDVDGTLKTERDPYVYLHRQLGCVEAGLASLAAYLAGEIDYDTFAQRDAALWRGTPIAQVEAWFAAVPWVPEARELVAYLQAAGIPIILLSTGLSHHVEQVAAEIGADDWVANELLVENGCLAGRINVRIEWGQKGRVVREYQARYGVGSAECLAVGDSSGDLGMFAEVGRRIAVNPHDDTLRASADFVLGEGDLREWLVDKGILAR